MKNLIVITALLSTTLFAGLAEDMQKLVGDNATSYVHPLTNSIGVSMNSGWYNSSKSYSFLKVPVGVQIYFGGGFSMVDDNLKTYDFKGAVATSNLGLPAFSGMPESLRVNVPGAPTSVGAKQGKDYTMAQLMVMNGVDTLTGANGIAWANLPAAKIGRAHV